jgi:hypothetical protein
VTLTPFNRWIPNCTFLSFSPISKVDGKSAWNQYTMAKKRFAEAKLDYFGILSIGMREMRESNGPTEYSLGVIN